MVDVMENKERYIGYGKLLDLPSGRVGLELTLNDLKELVIEMEKLDKVKILVLPVKEPLRVSSDDFRTEG